MTAPVATHLRRLVHLAIPVAASQLAAMLLMVVDLMMLGRVSVHALDAASLGRVWVMGTLVFGMGLLLGIDPLATQAWGAGDRARFRRTLGSGMVCALWISVPVGLLWLATGPVLELFGQGAGLADDAGRYARVQIPGLPFFFAFFVLKQVLQAKGSVLPAMWISFAANAFNALVNWILIFGKLGLPALGVVGAGIATTLTHVFLFVSLLLWTVRELAGLRWGALLRRGARLSSQLEIGRYGGPVAIQLGLEMWTFQITTLMAGVLGVVPLAAHTVAITLASLTFMAPLGISLAAVVRVGNLLGARKPGEARRAAWVSLGLGGGLMSLSGILFWVGRYHLPRWFTSDPDTVALAAAILPIAAAFQIVDGIQVVGSGILRGMGETLPAALFNLLGFYGLALPLGWWLAFRADLGVRGLWWGLAAGLTAVAVLLVGYIRRYGPGADR
ncbi:MAG: MATE family efflux transporter [Thermoanaerobaculia bacterium]|nr:MATE family efflux transporter [Thermoanaerobaculia bacterium]